VVELELVLEVDYEVEAVSVLFFVVDYVLRSLASFVIIRGEDALDQEIVIKLISINL